MVEDPPDQWHPEYLTILRSVEAGDREVMVPIQDRKFRECPVSALSLGEGPGIRQAAIAVIESEMMRKETGACLGGMDPARWPAKWFDFVSQAQSEEVLVRQVREEAVDAARRLG